MNTTPRIGLLLRLAHFLDYLPTHQFDYATVGSFQADYICNIEGPHCQTVGCAMGWAGRALPEYIRVNIEHMKRNAGTYDSARRIAWAFTFEIEGENYNFLKAARKLFRLTEEQASHLFIPSHRCPASPNLNNYLSKYSTPQTVANHIRQFTSQFKS